MRKILVQFHADPDELIGFIEDLRSEISFSIGFICMRPFGVFVINKDEYADLSEIIKGGDVARVVLSVFDVVMSDSNGGFFDKNPECLIFDIGKLLCGYLEESALSGFVESKIAVNFANKVVYRLKNFTKTGVVAVNPVNNVEASLKSHRYTKGAKILYDKGIRISPIAGNSYLKFI